MPNLDITSNSPYTRALNKITVTGTADAGVTVRVMIIPPQSIATLAEFNTKYNSVTTKGSATAVATPVIDETSPPPPATWSVQVSVSGLTAGTQYALYASTGTGKIEPQSPVTFIGT